MVQETKQRPPKGAHRKPVDNPAKSAAKHAANETPMGKVASAAYEKHAVRKQERKADRAKQKALVKRNVQQEQARLTAAHRLVTRPRVRLIVAEYVLALILAILGLFLLNGTYDDKVKKFFMQITGISAIFFVLALSGSSIKASRPAIMFGLLIDLAILLHLVQRKTQDAKIPAGSGGGGGRIIHQEAYQEVPLENDTLASTWPNPFAQDHGSTASPGGTYTA